MGAVKKRNIETKLRISKPESFGLTSASIRLNEEVPIIKSNSEEMGKGNEYIAKILPFNSEQKTSAEKKESQSEFMAHELHRSEDLKKKNSTKEAIEIYIEVSNSNYKADRDGQLECEPISNRLCGTLINKKHY